MKQLQKNSIQNWKLISEIYNWNMKRDKMVGLKRLQACLWEVDVGDIMFVTVFDIIFLNYNVLR